MLFTSVQILDSMYKCHYNLFMLQHCWFYASAIIDSESELMRLNSWCNLSLEPKITTVH